MLSFEDQTKLKVLDLMPTGRTIQEFRALYDEFHPYKEKNPAVYELALEIIKTRMEILGISGNQFFVISRLWRI